MPELSRLEQALTPRLTPYIPHGPTPPQTAFLLLDALEAFYGGAAGGGKSDALLMAALQYVDVPGYSALILRRTFPELSQPGAIMSRSHEWLGQWRKHGVQWNEQKKRWTFPSGATLTFGYLRSIRDVYQYQGAEFQFVGFDELTQFPEEPYTYLFSRLRRPEQGPLAQVPLRMRAASNPGNVGHGWVKNRLVMPDARQPGRVFIPAKLSDNPHLDRDTYVESLSHLGPILRRQLLDGDWAAFEGAAYPMFDPAVHLVEAFDVPDAWERFESFDPGTTNPAAILAYAIDHDGNILVFDELYVDDPVPHLPDVVVGLLKERRAAWHPDGATVVCFSDPAAFAQGTHTKWGRQPSVVDEFAAAGVALKKAFTNDRVAGYVRVGQLLAPDPTHSFPEWHPRAGQPGAPRIFFFPCCTHLVEQLQSAPLEELGEPHPGEAVSRRWEGPFGHAHAALRYGVISWPAPSERPYVPLDDDRAEWLRKYASQVEKPKRTPRDYQL